MQDYSINSIKFIKRKKCIDIFNKDGKYFFIQGPKGFCNKQIDSNSNYLWISYNKKNQTNQSFYSFLKELKENLEKMLFGVSIQSFYYENGLGITIQNFKGNNIVDLYYNKETIMDIIDCPERFYMKPLIWFQNVKCVDNKWYMNFCLVQAIIYPIYLKLGKCLIDDNQPNEYPDIYKSKIGIENTVSTENNKENEEMMSYSQHPIYSKYFKMLSMGIPKGAVLIKITNELGDSGKDILSHHPEDMIVVRKIKQSEHSHYMRFFRMLSMGIPKMAVEQKMILENIDISILNEPDKRILDLPIVSMDFGKILLSKKLKNTNPFKNITPLENKKNNRIQQFDMDDILKKRNEILNKIK
jgi:hypothetical protein